MSYVSYDFTSNFFGRPIEVSLETNIAQSIQSLLISKFGSLVYEPQEGSLIEKFVKYDNSFITKKQVEFYAKDAIIAIENRVNVERIEAILKPETRSLDLYVLYTIKESAKELQELTVSFTSAIDIPSDLPQDEDDLITAPPEITNVVITPDTFFLGEAGTLNVVISGVNFKSTSVVNFSSPIFQSFSIDNQTTTTIELSVAYDTNFGSVGMNLINTTVTSDLGTSNIFSSNLTINQDIFELTTISSDVVLRPSINAILTLQIDDSIGDTTYTLTNIQNFTLNNIVTNNPSTGELVLDVTIDNSVTDITFDVNGSIGRNFTVNQIISIPVAFTREFGDSNLVGTPMTDGQLGLSGAYNQLENGLHYPNNTRYGFSNFKLPVNEDGAIVFNLSGISTGAVRQGSVFFYEEGGIENNWFFGVVLDRNLFGAGGMYINERVDTINLPFNFTGAGFIGQGTNIRVEFVGNTINTYVDSTNTLINSFTYTRTTNINISVVYSPPKHNGTYFPSVGTNFLFTATDFYGNWIPV